VPPCDLDCHFSSLTAEAAALWLWAEHLSPILTGLSAIVSFLFLLYVGAFINRQMLLRRLHPVLSRLPATVDRITDADENDALGIALSAASISLTLRRLLKICGIVGVPLFFAALILPAIEFIKYARRC
jgi:hypothetical protein